MDKSYKKKMSLELGHYKVPLINKIFHNEKYYIYHYIKHLRLSEYYCRKPNVISKIFYKYHYYRLYSYSWRLGYQIPLFTCGWGIRFFHWGTIIINGKAKIGENVHLYPGVTVGSTAKGYPVIGNNVSLSLGCKIMGPVHIGNNVIVAPNSVVIKDVPDNCVVSGVPAQIIKRTL